MLKDITAKVVGALWSIMKPAMEGKKGEKTQQSCGSEQRSLLGTRGCVLRQNAEARYCVAGSFFFFSLKEIQLIFSPINWQQMKKKKSQNKTQTNASNLNVSVSEREKLFQLLDVQENMNTRRQRKRSQLEEEEGEVHKIKEKNSF